MISLSGLEDKKLWDIVKNYRSKYLIDNVNKLGSLSCFASDVVVLYETNTKSAVDSIEKELERFGSQHKNYDYNVYDYSDDFSTKDYERSGEMFIYLNLCPKFMFDWTQLYVDLFKNASPDIIVQTLNRIMVTGKVKEDEAVTNIARKIFDRVDKSNFLKFHTVDEFSKGKPNTTIETYDKIPSLKNMTENEISKFI